MGRARNARDIPSLAPLSVPVSRLDSRLRMIVIVQTRGRDSHMKMTGMIVVLLRGKIRDCRLAYGFQDENLTFLAVKLSF